MKTINKAITIFLLPLLLFNYSYSQGNKVLRSEVNNPEIASKNIHLNYLNNPYSDYLFYLFYRDQKKYALDSLLDLRKIPTLSSLISLQEIVASAKIKSYKDIYKYAGLYKNPAGRKIDEPYPKIIAYSDEIPKYDSVMYILNEGEKYFDTFYNYWKQKIEPNELKTIESWGMQDSLHHPFDTLQQIERIRFKSDTLDVACIALHLSGSGNYSPPGVYTSIFKKPDLARVLGHEGTHLLLTRYYGKDWHKYKLAPEAINVATKNDLAADDIEEMLCMFMQTKLSQRFGYTDANKKISASFDKEKAKQKILIEMENNWESYLSDKDKYVDIIDFMLKNAISAFEIK